MKTLIKICGIKRLDDLECAIQNGADLIGFVFVKSSPRYIEPSSVTNLLQSVPEKIKTVAVMQHATQNSLDSILDSFKPTYIQTDANDFLSLDLPSNIKKIRYSILYFINCYYFDLAKHISQNFFTIPNI